ncbi:MAG TPA: hypothetical protein VII30_09600 [Gemmatimonadaceae bacterium]
MSIVLNILAAVFLVVVQAWIAPMVGLFVISLPLITPVRWLQHGMESSEDYAAEHPRFARPGTLLGST